MTNVTNHHLGFVANAAAMATYRPIRIMVSLLFSNFCSFLYGSFLSQTIGELKWAQIVAGNVLYQADVCRMKLGTL